MSDRARYVLSGSLLLLTVFVACERNGAARRRIEPTYDPATGQLQLLKYDSNDDREMDTWSYMAGTKVVRIEIDTDADGLVDRWEYYNAGERIEKIGSSRGRDGSADSWVYYGDDGRIVRVELAAREGAAGRVEYYENGMVARADEDTTGDGQTDKWEVYENGRLASVEFDTSDSGVPDRRLVYGEDGTAQLQTLAHSAEHRP